MTQTRDGPNWKKIKAEYIRGGISQQKLADKYGVSISTIERRARLEKWTELRRAREGKAAEKLVEKTADIQADTATRLLQIQSRAALAVYEKLLQNIENYPDGVGTKTVRETVEVKKIKVNDKERDVPLHSTFTNDLESIVRSMAALARMLGIDAASKHAQERFDYQKKQGGGDGGDDEFNERMLSLSELIKHPLPDRSLNDVESSTEGGDSDG